MSEELKKVRKGTRSCTECRRRKVRCTWSSDDASVCRRCEERGSNCVAQVYSLQTTTSGRLTSRDRISRLEKQVVTLTKALRGAEVRSSESSPSTFEVAQQPAHEEDSATDGDDYFSNDDEATLAQGPPSHFHTLFDNDLITSDSQDTQQQHRTKLLQELSTAVRLKLQQLIPAQNEVEIIAAYASKWLALFHALFPTQSIIKSGEDMVSSYDRVKDPNVEPAYLASWLVTIAMTLLQVPKTEMEQHLKKIRNPIHYVKAVSDAVEVTIVRQDALLGTIEGIDCALLFLRLQLSRGNFKKTWLQLRRVIAVAEMIGLHRSAHRGDLPLSPPREGSMWSDAPANSSDQKEQVWESLCSVDRISGMMFNLPAGTRRHRSNQSASVIVNGQVSLRAYLSQLSEIASKVQDLDDESANGGQDAETYATVLKIDGELRVLASLTPASWWQNGTHLSDQLLQYWHYYINARIHLPFTLRHDTIEQFSFSRLACMKACQTLALRYLILRPQLPSGFFLCRIIDLQAFTTTIILTLAYHASSPMERANLHSQGLQAPELLVPRVVEYMKSVANQPAADFARRGYETISALCRLLDVDTSKDNNKDLVLKVPLIGRLHVRRNQQSFTPASENRTLQEVVGQTGLLHQGPLDQCLDGIGQTLPTEMLPTSLPVPMGYTADPLSWSIEDDHQGFFQDALMTEEFSPLEKWLEQSSISSFGDYSMIS